MDFEKLELSTETLRELDDEGILASSFAILSWSGERTPPGNLHAIPTMAIGSSPGLVPSGAGGARTIRSPRSSARR